MKEVTVRPTHENNETDAADDKTMLGFWIYIMTDCVLFASLFATFAVLRNATAGGPTGQELFNLNFILTETIILLTSSFAIGMGVLAARRGDSNRVLLYLLVTFILGMAFVVMELTEFRQLAHEGNSWTRSAFLSSFFTLVGTHGLHITAGLTWMLVMIWQVIQRGLTGPVLRRLTLLSIFWHFLDLIWIFIFTIVYLLGVIQ